MDWLNLHISVLDSPQVLRCDPVRRATWLFLLRYCISQENGGVIEDCAIWGDTSWQQVVRVKLREVRAKSPLWTWEGDNLRVTFYPIEKEVEVQAKRESARTNGQRGGRPKKTNVGFEKETDKEPTSVNSAKAEGNGMGRERKAPAADAAVAVPDDLPDPVDQPRAKIAMAAAAETWMDFKMSVGRGRIYISHDGNSEADWKVLFNRAGWGEFCKAWEWCAAHTEKPGGKVFLGAMLEVLHD